MVELKQVNAARKAPALSQKEIERRRLALQIATQLPVEPLEALAVLQATMMLISSFFETGGL